MTSPRLPGAPAPSALASTAPLHLLTSLTHGPVQDLGFGPRPPGAQRWCHAACPALLTTSSRPAPLPRVSTWGVFQAALALFSPDSLFRCTLSRLVRSLSICWRISKSLLQSVISPSFGPFSHSMNCFYSDIWGPPSSMLAVQHFPDRIHYLSLQISSPMGTLIPGNDTPVFHALPFLLTDLLLMQHLGVWLNVTCFREAFLEPLRPPSSYILFRNSCPSCNYILICYLFHVISSPELGASRTGTVTTAHSAPSATAQSGSNTYLVNKRLQGCACVTGMLLIHHILNLFILNSYASLW